MEVWLWVGHSAALLVRAMISWPCRRHGRPQSDASYQGLLNCVSQAPACKKCSQVSSTCISRHGGVLQSFEMGIARPAMLVASKRGCSYTNQIQKQTCIGKAGCSCTCLAIKSACSASGSDDPIAHAGGMVGLKMTLRNQPTST